MERVEQLGPQDLRLLLIKQGNFVMRARIRILVYEQAPGAEDLTLLEQVDGCIDGKIS